MKAYGAFDTWSETCGAFARLLEAVRADEPVWTWFLARSLVRVDFLATDLILQFEHAGALRRVGTICCDQHAIDMAGLELLKTETPPSMLGAVISRYA